MVAELVAHDEAKRSLVLFQGVGKEIRMHDYEVMTEGTRRECVEDAVAPL